MRNSIPVYLMLVSGMSAGHAEQPWLIYQVDGESMPAPGIDQVPGKFGKALRFLQGARLTVATQGHLDRRRGTVCLWARPDWDAPEKHSHAFFADDRAFKPGNNSLVLWEWYTGLLRFDVRDPNDRYLTYRVKDWHKGEWRHLAAAWDCSKGTWLFLDGTLVASRRLQWDPQPSKSFFIGAKPSRRDWNANADIDDVRIYNVPLSASQVRRTMSGGELVPVQYRRLLSPAHIETGKQFTAKLFFSSAKPLPETERVQLLLDGLILAEGPAGKGPGTAQLRARVPEYLYLSPGKHSLLMRLAGALEEDIEKARAEVTLTLPAGPEAPRERRIPDRGGLLVHNHFLEGANARSFLKDPDAFPCRLVDQVDCSETGHGYWENAPATVEELSPGTQFRCVGSPAKVTQKIQRRGRSFQALPAFSYRLKVRPRPTPHLIVIESINDAERYLEVAIDFPRNSRLAPHLAASGAGRREAINLSVTYTGREYATDGKSFRQAFMIFPKTSEVEVLISGTARGRLPDASPAAVSHIWVYEAATPLASLANPILLPEGQPQRTVSIFFPAPSLLFEKYGFAGATRAMRASTLRLFIDTMRFMGLNRFEFRPFQLSEKIWTKTPRFQSAGDLDMFAEVLPLMEEAGFQVVPRVMYLHSYHRLLEDDPENFQHSSDGSIQRFGREGPIPDPLRPPVQKVILDSFRAFLEACDGYGNVPEVGFDTSIGGLYFNGKDPTSHSGYSQWDLKQFAKDTGTQVPGGLDSPGKRFDWLKANSWAGWVNWRCRKWHGLVARIRDLAAAKGKKLELSVRIMPREEFLSDKVPIRTIYRYTGFDPELFTREKGIEMDTFIRINSDRYFGRPWWKTWFYDAQQVELFRSQEPNHVELYFNYWELPFHPWGFRVGPGSPAGRAFFEPITRAMRNFNPYDLTFFNWFTATIGREFEVREFSRAFRALPALPPRPFKGQVQTELDRDRLWIRWIGDRLAIVNDSPSGGKLALRFSLPGANRSRIFDAASARILTASPKGQSLELTLRLRPYDLKALVFADK